MQPSAASGNCAAGYQSGRGGACRGGCRQAGQCRGIARGRGASIMVPMLGWYAHPVRVRLVALLGAMSLCLTLENAQQAQAGAGSRPRANVSPSVSGECTGWCHGRNAPATKPGECAGPTEGRSEEGTADEEPQPDLGSAQRVFAQPDGGGGKARTPWIGTAGSTAAWRGVTTASAGGSGRRDVPRFDRGSLPPRDISLLAPKKQAQGPPAAGLLCRAPCG